MERLTAIDVARASGLSVQMVRRLTDRGMIPCQKDYNNWRIYSSESIKVARRLAGTSEEENNYRSNSC
jgi:DNA-binding transcriptional MerR regulator